MQQRLTPHVDRLLSVGLPDMRPAALPQRFTEALDTVGPWVRDHGSGPQRSMLRRLHEFTAEFGQLCADLATRSPLASIDHNDLHAANVVGTPEHPRYYDWGDSVVAHPYASLLTPTATVPDDAAGALRDAYLQQWPSAPSDALKVAALACRLGCVARALVWHRAVGHDPDHEFAYAPFYYLAKVLDAPA